MNLSVSRYHRRLLLVVMASWALSALWFLLLFLRNSGIVNNGVVSYCVSASFFIALMVPGVTIIAASLRWHENALWAWRRIFVSGCAALVLGAVFLTLPYAMLGPENAPDAFSKSRVGYFLSLITTVWPWIFSMALTLLILAMEIVQHRKVKATGNIASPPKSGARA